MSAIVYLLGFIGSIPDPFASPIWPATGFQIAMYFRYGKKALIAMTPGLAIIMFQSGYTGGMGLYPSLVFAFIGITAMMSEAVIAHYFTRPSQQSLDDEASFLRFTFLGAPIGTFSSALQGVSVLLFFNAYPSDIDLYIPYVVWSSGNLIGAYALVPLLTMSKEHLESLKKNYGTTILFTLVGFFIIWLHTHNPFEEDISALVIVFIIVPIYFLIKLKKYAVIVTVLSLNSLYYIFEHLNHHVVTSENFSLYDMLSTQTIIVLILAGSMIFFNQLKKNAQLSKQLKQQNESLNEIVDARTSELKEINEKLKETANVDYLTHIYNRRYFYEVSSGIIKLARRDNKKCSFAMIDIDDFKKINDTYGHDVGDKVLQSIATDIKNKIRESDLFARYGGEEFVILFPETDITGALSILKTIREHIDNIKQHEEISVTVSIGATEFDFEKDTIDDAIKRTDIALYKSKNSGKNMVSVEIA